MRSSVVIFRVRQAVKQLQEPHAQVPNQGCRCQHAGRGQPFQEVGEVTVTRRSDLGEQGGVEAVEQDTKQEQQGA